MRPARTSDETRPSVSAPTKASPVVPQAAPQSLQNDTATGSPLDGSVQVAAESGISTPDTAGDRPDAQQKAPTTTLNGVATDAEGAPYASASRDPTSPLPSPDGSDSEEEEDATRSAHLSAPMVEPKAAVRSAMRNYTASAFAVPKAPTNGVLRGRAASDIVPVLKAPPPKPKPLETIVLDNLTHKVNVPSPGRVWIAESIPRLTRRKYIYNDAKITHT